MGESRGMYWEPTCSPVEGENSMKWKETESFQVPGMKKQEAGMEGNWRSKNQQEVDTSGERQGGLQPLETKPRTWLTEAAKCATKCFHRGTSSCWHKTASVSTGRQKKCSVCDSDEVPRSPAKVCLSCIKPRARFELVSQASEAVCAC